MTQDIKNLIIRAADNRGTDNFRELCELKSMGIRIIGDRVIENGKVVAHIRRAYSSRRTNLEYKELNRKPQIVEVA